MNCCALRYHALETDPYNRKKLDLDFGKGQSSMWVGRGRGGYLIRMLLVLALAILPVLREIPKAHAFRYSGADATDKALANLDARTNLPVRIQFLLAVHDLITLRLDFVAARAKLLQYCFLESPEIPKEITEVTRIKSGADLQAFCQPYIAKMRLDIQDHWMPMRVELALSDVESKLPGANSELESPVAPEKFQFNRQISHPHRNFATTVLNSMNALLGESVDLNVQDLPPLNPQEEAIARYTYLLEMGRLNEKFIEEIGEETLTAWGEGERLWRARKRYRQTHRREERESVHLKAYYEHIGAMPLMLYLTNGEPGDTEMHAAIVQIGKNARAAREKLEEDGKRIVTTYLDNIANGMEPFLAEDAAVRVGLHYMGFKGVVDELSELLLALDEEKWRGAIASLRVQFDYDHMARRIGDGIFLLSINAMAMALSFGIAGPGFAVGSTALVGVIDFMYLYDAIVSFEQTQTQVLSSLVASDSIVEVRQLDSKSRELLLMSIMAPAGTFLGFMSVRRFLTPKTLEVMQNTGQDVSRATLGRVDPRATGASFERIIDEAITEQVRVLNAVALANGRLNGEDIIRVFSETDAYEEVAKTVAAHFPRTRNASRWGVLDPKWEGKASLRQRARRYAPNFISKRIPEFPAEFYSRGTVTIAEELATGARGFYGNSRKVQAEALIETFYQSKGMKGVPEELSPKDLDELLSYCREQLDPIQEVGTLPETLGRAIGHRQMRKLRRLDGGGDPSWANLAEEYFVHLYYVQVRRWFSRHGNQVAAKYLNAEQFENVDDLIAKFVQRVEENPRILVEDDGFFPGFMREHPEFLSRAEDQFAMNVNKEAFKKPFDEWMQVMDEFEAKFTEKIQRIVLMRVRVGALKLCRANFQRCQRDGVWLPDIDGTGRGVARQRPVTSSELLIRQEIDEEAALARLLGDGEEGLLRLLRDAHQARADLEIIAYYAARNGRMDRVNMIMGSLHHNRLPQAGEWGARRVEFLFTLRKAYVEAFTNWSTKSESLQAQARNLVFFLPTKSLQRSFGFNAAAVNNTVGWVRWGPASLSSVAFGAHQLFTRTGDEDRKFELEDIMLDPNRSPEEFNQAFSEYCLRGFIPACRANVEELEKLGVFDPEAQTPRLWDEAVRATYVQWINRYEAAVLSKQISDLQVKSLSEAMRAEQQRRKDAGIQGGFGDKVEIKPGDAQYEPVED